MALPVTNIFAGTDDATITTGNSGGASGTAFDAVTIGTSCVAKYENTDPLPGFGTTFEFSTAGTSASVFCSWTTAVGTNATVYGRFYFYITAAPAGNSSIFSTNTGGTARARIQELTSRKIRLIDSLAATIWTSTTTPAVNTWYRCEYQITHDTSAGTARIFLFTGHSTTADEDSGALTGINFGDVSCTGIRHGCVANQTNFPATRMAGVQVNATGFPGPVFKSATVSTAFTFSAPATAVVKVPATVATSFTFAAPAAAVVKVPAAVSSTFAFSGPASATVKVPATVSSSFTFAAPATAVVKVPASVATSFTFSAPTSATVSHPAMIATAFSFAAPASAVVTVPVTVATVFDFAAPAAATVTPATVLAVRASSVTTLTAGRTSVAAVTARRTSAPVASAGRASAPTVSGG